MRLQPIILLLLAVLLTACKDANIQSPVPQAAVYLDIDILGQYPWFVSEAPGQSLTFPKPIYARDAVGYAGVIVWIDFEGQYCAADMCCPKCIDKAHPIEVEKNSCIATCPNCGEVFNLTLQYGVPTKGICKDILKPYWAHYSYGVLQIRN